jgi:hypothetical protein
MAPMITTNDFAVVIGISRYPQLSNLKNPVRNALAFAEWLTDPSGGALPPKNLKLVISNENSPDGDSAGPIQDDVDVAFRSLLGLPRTVQIGRRLYIYMAGHGYRSNSDQVALLLADASPTLMHSIATRAYADYIRQAGVFSEIVLFVDCDPAALSTGHLSPPPPFPRSIDSQSARPASVFYAFASTRGGASISSASISSAAVSSTNKQIIEDGLFSRALLEGLRGAAAASDGSVTSDALREYAAQRVRELGGREQQPEFLYEEGSPIVFVNPVQRKLLERVGAHADDPAIVDELGRRPFAEVIAARIEDVRKTQAAFRAMGDKSAGGAFMVHIHGPWGAGKTSVLNFLRDHLQDKKRCPAQQWVVVEFNAWRQQRIRPPWWTLIKEIYMQSARQLGFFRSLQLRVRWLAWRIRADWLPALLATLLISVAVLLSTGVLTFFRKKRVLTPRAAWRTSRQRQSSLHSRFSWLYSQRVRL